VFTGIVEALGWVRSLQGGRLIVEPDVPLEGLQAGESVAINGCCLTAVEDRMPLLFDLSPETLARTSLGDLVPGSVVNVERAMKADGRFGGHLVQGHVDAAGTVVSVIPSGNSVVYRFQAPTGFGRYLIDKGSVAVDGISLTVVSPKADQFDVWVIPHTLERTNLGTRVPGDRVNLEFDMVAKYIERLVAPGSEHL
jgi:riboflavin synthase